MESNPGNLLYEDTSGIFLFRQRGEEGHMRVYGRACLGYEELGEVERRGLAITTNAYDDDADNCNNNGAVFNPFTQEEGTRPYNNLRDIEFGEDGLGIYRHRDNKTTLFGENSIAGRSMSLYESDEQSGNIDACC